MGEYAIGLLPLLVIGAVTWMASVPRRDVSIVDPVWSLLFVAAGLTWWWRAGYPDDARSSASLALVIVWGLRLALHLTLRKWGDPEEDRRYAKMRSEVGPSFWIRSLVTVFTLQAVLAWIVAAPVFIAVGSARPDLGAVAWGGIALWVVGFLFQAVGDLQLTRFRSDPQSKGAVLDHGLWRFSRHPNYFGEFCMWWGLGLIAVEVGTPAAWCSLLGPLGMSFLLLRVSGVTMLESDIEERRPEYAAYIRRTSAFFPWPPRS